MLAKTRAVVLHKTRYSDSASIVTLYTEQFGRVSCMVRGIHSKRSAVKSAFFQPLSVLELDMSFQPGKELHTIKDIRISFPVYELSSDPLKNAIALFLSEVLYRSLKISITDERLFLFLVQSVEVLDCTHDVTANFHLVFLYKLTRYLGFEPDLSGESRACFDLQNGVFSAMRPLHMHYITGEVADKFFDLSQTDYFAMSSLLLSRHQRAELLKILVEYYRLHVPGFHAVNSLTVLQALFD